MKPSAISFPYGLDACHGVVNVQASRQLLIFNHVGEGCPGLKYLFQTHKGCFDRRLKEARPEPAHADPCSEATWTELAAGV